MKTRGCGPGGLGHPAVVMIGAQKPPRLPRNPARGAERWLVVLVLLVAWVASARHGRVAGGEPASRRTLLVLGDSLAAGYGLDPAQAFPGLLQGWIDRDGLGFEVVNAGVSGDTTAGGLRRLGWLLRRPVDVLLVELGGNDGLRGLAPEATQSNLVAIVQTARTRHPGVRVVLAGMQMPPNMGADYAARFRALYPEVARAHRCDLVPHLLEGVGGDPELNQPDLIHPTARGQAMVASNVWSVLRPILADGTRAGRP